MMEFDAAIAGDLATFTRLIAPLHRELHTHAYRMTASSSDAEDAVQDALLSAWQGLVGIATRQRFVDGCSESWRPPLSE